MAKLFNLEIYTPERLFFKGEISSLVVNTMTGQLGIMYNSLPITTMLSSGVIKIKHNDKWAEAVNSDGIVVVKKNDVTILADKCLWPHEIVDGGQEEEEEELSPLESKQKREQSLRDYRMAKAQLAAQFAKLQNKKSQ